MPKVIQTLSDFLSARDLLIIDFEATCWGSGDNKPMAPAGCRYPNEIIEFGAVLFCLREEGDEPEFQAFVRPAQHTVLTDFCTELTSIRQEQVDSAEEFPEVLQRFVRYFELSSGGHSGPLFASWGAYDRNQLLDDCRKHQVSYPFVPDEHLNLKHLVADVLGMPRTKRGTVKVFRQLGLEFKGTRHRAIDDARNYAYLLRYLVRVMGNRSIDPDTLLAPVES